MHTFPGSRLWLDGPVSASETRTDRFEYTCLRMAGVLTKAVERDWPAILNRHAADGWRLVTVDQSVAFFERARTR